MYVCMYASSGQTGTWGPWAVKKDRRVSRLDVAQSTRVKK